MDERTFDERLRACDLHRANNATVAVALCDTLLSEPLSASQASRVRVERKRTVDSVNDMISDEYVVDGRHLLDTRATMRSNYKNALRELNQKRIKNSHSVRVIKRRYRRDGGFECPHCKGTFCQLTAAHVSSSASSMIDRVIDDNPSADLQTLYDRLVRDHDEVQIAICCRACNYQLERTPSES